MKNLLKTMVVFGLVILFAACTAELSEPELELEAPNAACVNNDPITRVVNNGTIAFDLIVLNDAGDVVVSILNIPPSSTTSWASFPAGEVLFSISNNEPLVNDDKVLLQMDNCTAFDIEIDNTNSAVSYTPIAL
jgi:hypothetical protein